MAGLAVPLIEGVAVRVLGALGVGVVAGAAGEAAKEAARRRQEEADKARASPIARTDAQTTAKEKCKECPPDKGAPISRPTAGWSEGSIAYQARIGGLPVGPGFITEWMFNAVTFDGFDSGQCLLKEAKARYDQFFDEFGRREPFWQGHLAMFDQAVAQSAVAIPQPPVHLRWYFMESKSYRFFSIMFTDASLPIETEFQP
jgi:hypothetical protein